ncbi:phosphatase PAP2 family protein [Paenibacillus gansuensis]|uniref:Phosphatase PAP2 family protein n=1 Tax=Paenibacillus gansuensis TaxID=306542 RepID=A0ABW5PCB3_9BACL
MKSIYAGVSAVSVVCFVLLTWAVHRPWMQTWDTDTANQIRNAGSSSVQHGMKAVSSLGDSAFFLIALLILCAVLVMGLRRWKEALLVFGAFAVSYALNTLLKAWIGRERPSVEQLVTADGYSMPSGNAMLSMVLYGLAIYFVRKYVRNEVTKKAATAFFTLLILLIGSSRIYLGVHYPSDIIAGYLAGLVMVCAAAGIDHKLHPQQAVWREMA